MQTMMKKSLAHAIDLSVADFACTDRCDWVKKWQGQVSGACHDVVLM
jgi:hypothetical protein